jgi:hypothetical protein
LFLDPPDETPREAPRFRPRGASVLRLLRGALRRCIFTNGTFEEPIQVWRAPRELTFGVRKQPAAVDDYLNETCSCTRHTRALDHLASEGAALALASRGVRVSVVRLPLSRTSSAGA